MYAERRYSLKAARRCRALARELEGAARRGFWLAAEDHRARARVWRKFA